MIYKVKTYNSAYESKEERHLNNQQNNKNDKNDKDNKKKNAKILAIFLIVSILGTFFFNSILTKWRNGTEKTISYNKFVTMLDKDQVKSVKVTDSQLKVTPKNEGNPFYKTTYTVQRISGDYELVNRLIKSKIAFEQEPEDPMDTFLSILISLIPTIVIFGFLVMMMRRSSGMIRIGLSTPIIPLLLHHHDRNPKITIVGIKLINIDKKVSDLLVPVQMRSYS